MLFMLNVVHAECCVIYNTEFGNGVILLSVITVCVIVLGVIILSVIILNVVAPFSQPTSP
jgi:hypothetical protein